MPFKKGDKGGPGRTKGPDKVKLSGYIIEHEKMNELIELTGYTQGELVDVLLKRANAHNLRVKK